MAQALDCKHFERDMCELHNKKAILQEELEEAEDHYRNTLAKILKEEQDFLDRTAKRKQTAKCDRVQEEEMLNLEIMKVDREIMDLQMMENVNKTKASYTDLQGSLQSNAFALGSKISVSSPLNPVNQGIFAAEHDEFESTPALLAQKEQRINTSSGQVSQHHPTDWETQETAAKRSRTEKQSQKPAETVPEMEFDPGSDEDSTYEPEEFSDEDSDQSL
ncbi:hypothetical protein LTR66_004704 [Elasticomyces elasticus]|nr:hypothetical protein LTR66_004704 [Elasticomyces elasticus]KAK5009647.1 hypothetical protein LTR28_000019 [Elasticomyces elasticus]